MLDNKSPEGETMPENNTKVLDYYVRYDRKDAVQIGFVGTMDGSEVKGVKNGSDADLTERALTLKKTTWDEDVICSLYDMTRKPEEVQDDAASAEETEA